MVIEAGMDWTYNESLYSFTADLGEYVYIIPKGHSIKHNNDILTRIYSKMGLDSTEVVLMHHDLTIPVGEVTNLTGPSSVDPEEREYENEPEDVEDEDQHEDPEGQEVINNTLYVVDTLIRDVSVPRISIGVLPRSTNEGISLNFFSHLNGLSEDKMVTSFASNPFPEHDLMIIEDKSLSIVKEKILGRAEVLSVYDTTTRY